MAYMINRAGMEKVLRRAGYVPASLLDAPGFSPDQMRTRKEWRGDDGVFTRAVPHPGGHGGQQTVTIPLPIVADGWLYQSASSYWVSYPMFGWLSFSASAIQRGKLGLDSTDAQSNEQAEKFYEGLRGGASKPPADPLSIAVVATVFAADQPRHLANVDALVGATPSSTPSAGGQVLLAAKRKRDGAQRKVRWTYAVNAMDNDLGVWSRTAFTSKGIFLMAQASGRRNNTFESRLISQLPLVDALLYSVATDYIWLVDGDISFKPTDIPGLEALLAAKGDDRVLAAQPAIDAAPDKPKPFAGGDQFFKPLNGGVAKEVRARCGLKLLPTPLVEIQAPVLASSFLAWHMPELRFVAAMQAKEQSAWGPDMLWWRRHPLRVDRLPAAGLLGVAAAVRRPPRLGAPRRHRLDRPRGERDERGAAPPRQAREGHAQAVARLRRHRPRQRVVGRRRRRLRTAQAERRLRRLPRVQHGARGDA